MNVAESSMARIKIIEEKENEHDGLYISKQYKSIVSFNTYFVHTLFRAHISLFYAQKSYYNKHYIGFIYEDRIVN